MSWEKLALTMAGQFRPKKFHGKNNVTITRRVQEMKKNLLNSEYGLTLRRNEVRKFIKVLELIHPTDILLSTYNVLAPF